VARTRVQATGSGYVSAGRADASTVSTVHVGAEASERSARPTSPAQYPPARLGRGFQASQLRAARDLKPLTAANGAQDFHPLAVSLVLAWKPAVRRARPALALPGDRSVAASPVNVARRVGGSRGLVGRLAMEHVGILLRERRRTSMATNVRCRLGKHEWRSRGRGDALTYFCQVCGKTRDKPPRPRTGGSEAPWLPGTGGPMGGGM